MTPVHRQTSRSAKPLFAHLRTLGLIVLCGGIAGLTIATLTLHLGFRPVLTGSMRPAFGPGALILTRQVPVVDVHPGMVVLFVPPGQHAEFAHRVTSVSGPADARVITTKGDANPAPDPWHTALHGGTVPEVVASVPWVGRLMVGFRGPLQAILILIGGLAFAVSGARRILQAPPQMTHRLA